MFNNGSYRDGSYIDFSQYQVNSSAILAGGFLLSIPMGILLAILVVGTLGLVIFAACVTLATAYFIIVRPFYLATAFTYGSLTYALEQQHGRRWDAFKVNMARMPKWVIHRCYVDPTKRAWMWFYRHVTGPTYHMVRSGANTLVHLLTAPVLWIASFHQDAKYGQTPMDQSVFWARRHAPALVGIILTVVIGIAVTATLCSTPHHA